MPLEYRMQEEEENILARWLQGDISLEEKKKLEETYDLESLEAVLKKQGELELTTVSTSVMWETIEEKMTDKSTVNRYFKWKMIIGLIGGLLLLALVLWKWGSQGEERIKAEGEIERLHFADNTEIDIVPGSELSYDKSNNLEERLFHLKGQAFFNVPTPGPFTVITSRARVEVMGTQFDVWEVNSDETYVRCFEGSVRVSGEGGSVELNPMEQVLLTSDSIGEVRKTTESEPLWMNGTKRYERVKLKDVVHDLACFYPYSFPEIENNSVFNGVLPLKDIEKALDYLSVATGKTYRLENQKVVVE